MRRLAVACGVTAMWLVTTAHVGSPHAFFEGPVGPYPASVTIRMPGAIPGQATVLVRTVADVRIAVRPVRWDAGLAGAPSREPASVVSRSSGLHAATLWLMTRGAYYIEISASGARGSGTVYVPVSAVSTTRIDVPPGLAALLVALGLLLVVSGAAIVGGAARDAFRPRGTPAVSGDERRARVAMVAATCVLLVVCTGGARWWAFEDAAHRDALFRPYSMTADIVSDAGSLALRLRIGDSRWMDEQWTPLIPEHDKLLHVFVVSDDLGALAHLHPHVQEDGRTFLAAMPRLPPARYRVYADITQESGFSQTLTASAIIPPVLSIAARDPVFVPSDPDDSWDVARSHRAGTTGLRLRAPTVIGAGREWTLLADAQDVTGAPLDLEPYMGMLGHAIISRGDGGVFVHLHPHGSISMASQQIFAERELVDGPAPETTDVHGAHAPPSSSAVSFRFVFPEPGRYRVWVQARSRGELITEPFDVMVGAGR